MILPRNINDWINERIQFCENNIRLSNKISEEIRKECLTNFEKSLTDYKKLKQMFSQINEHPDNEETKNSFKESALKKIDQIQEIIEDQLTGYLPLITLHDLLKLKDSLNNIQNQVQQI